jgi:hypothetical protein
MRFILQWTRRRIIEEIRALHGRGEELNYAAAEENHLNLVRASAWHFGTWRRAVERAGLDYESASKYRRWTRERVLARIANCTRKVTICRGASFPAKSIRHSQPRQCVPIWVLVRGTTQ